MEKNDEQIFEEFISQITRWANDGTPPECCSLDLNYALELQRKRMAEKNVSVSYNYKLRGEHLDNIAKKTWSDNRYQNVMAWRSYRKTANYNINGKCKLRQKKKEISYAIITRLLNQNTDATYCCPNCGAIQPVKILLVQGCPNCHTRFLMSDLFPKVTNYFFVKDQGYNGKELKHILGGWVFLCAVAVMVFQFINMYNQGTLSFSDPESMFKSAFGIVASGAIGAFLGYVLWAFGKIFSVFIDGAKTIGMLGPHYKAKYKLPKFMKQFDPNFSYEYFTGKIMSMLKLMIFSDDYTNLAAYEGPQIQNTFKDIIDIQYRGALGLNDYRIQGNYCHLDITVYTMDFYCKGNSINKKNEKFRMTVCKNIAHPPDYNFSIRKVQCKSCGASFDAARERHCPYCRSDYHLAEDDWVITSFRKI